MHLPFRIYFSCTFFKKIQQKSLKAQHGPTTQCWPIGQGIFPSSQIKISGWNVNGYRSIIQKGTLSYFIQSQNPDFMCLNQTKICYKNFTNLDQHRQNPFINYNGYWNFCKIKSGYSGVAIFAKYKPMSIFEDFPQQPQYSLQGRVLTLEYQYFFIVCIYNPSSGLQLERLAFRTQQFDNAFNRHIISLRQQKPVVIFGDMNVAHYDIDLAKSGGKQRHPGFTIQQRANFGRLLKENHMVDTYRLMYPFSRKYSWWNYRTRAREYNDGWRLDYILADRRLPVLKASIHNQIMGSDHCPVSAVISLNEIK